MRQLFGDWARINGPIQERTTGIRVTIILPLNEGELCG